MDLSEWLSNRVDSCNVSVDTTEAIRRKVRKSVCKELDVFPYQNGQHYCILHFPSENKDKKLFVDTFQSRFRSTNELARGTSRGTPIATGGVAHDYRYVWFPSPPFRRPFTRPSQNRFECLTNFTGAVFAGGADFRGTKFLGKAIFNSSKFKKRASFAGATFDREVSFDNAEFNEGAFFGSSGFIGAADFKRVIFESTANFDRTRFSSKVFFNNCRFEGTSDFVKSIFLDSVRFEDSKFAYFNIDKCTNLGDLNLHDCTFSDTFRLANSVMVKSIECTRCVFDSNFTLSSGVYVGDVSFLDSSFNGKYRLSSSTFLGRVDFSESVFGRNSLGELIANKFFNALVLAKTKLNGFMLIRGEEDNPVFLEKDEIDAQFKTLRTGLEERLSRVAYGHGSQTEQSRLERPQEEAFLSLQYALILRPENLHFHRVRLRPSFYIQSDASRLVYTDVIWELEKGAANNVRNELKLLESRGIDRPLNNLTIAYRQLAENCESSRDFRMASFFRECGFEAEWMGSLENLDSMFNGTEASADSIRAGFGHKSVDLSAQLKSVLRIVDFYLLEAAYRFCSRFGESWLRAFFVLLLIWGVFSIVYTYSPFEVCSNFRSENSRCLVRPLELSEAMIHSANKMILQRSDARVPIGISNMFEFIEMILSPVQIAVLALAVRRRFLR